MDWKTREKSKEFRDLKREWYEKLKQTGFVDVEEERDNSRMKQRSTYPYRKTDQLTRESKQRYYEMLSQHIAGHRFRDPVERAIMALTAQGNLIAEICERLKVMGTPRHRQTVRFIVRRYENKWGIRKWSQEQMNSKAPTK